MPNTLVNGELRPICPECKVPVLANDLDQADFHTASGSKITTHASCLGRELYRCTEGLVAPTFTQHVSPGELANFNQQSEAANNFFVKFGKQQECANRGAKRSNLAAALLESPAHLDALYLSKSPNLHKDVAYALAKYIELETPSGDKADSARQALSKAIEHTYQLSREASNAAPEDPIAYFTTLIDNLRAAPDSALAWLLLGEYLGPQNYIGCPEQLDPIFNMALLSQKVCYQKAAGFID